jgi:hypothetical protein
MNHIKMHVVLDSCSEIGLLHFSWLVKLLARFGKYRRNCASDEGKCGLTNTGRVK